MVVVRATRKVLSRVPDEFIGPPSRSTTALGDWYANLLSTREVRLVLVVSERSLLSVLVPAPDWANFPERFRKAVGDVLIRLSASRDGVAAELREMQEVTFDRTRNRTVLGSMNDLAFQARGRLGTCPDISLTDLAYELSQVPCRPLKYRHPREVAVGLLAQPVRVVALSEQSA